MSDADFTIETLEYPREPDFEELVERIRAHDARVVGLPMDARGLWMYLRDARGEMVGGFYGELYFGWMFVSIVWIADALRGRGEGRRLMEAAEREAVARGCHGAWLDTFSEDAVRFYRRLGWEVFGRLDDYPPGHARTFLRKRLADAPSGGGRATE